MEEREELNELIGAMVGAYLGSKAVDKGIGVAKKAVQTGIAKSSTRMQRKDIIKRAKQTEVGSAERKAALKQSKKLKQDLEKRIQSIKKAKPKAKRKPKKPFSQFRKSVKRAIRKVKR